jgi:hypothetical protein
MPNNILKAMAQHLKLKLPTLEHYYDEAKAQADKKFKKKDKSYYAYIMSIVRNRANARSKRNAKKSSELVASVAETSDEKIIAREFMEQGFRQASVNGNDVLSFIGTVKEFETRMGKLELSLRKGFGYTNVSKVEGVQWIFYPPNRKLPKFMIEREQDDNPTNVGKFNMYFE